VAGVWLATEFDTTFVVESGRPAEIFSFLAAIQAIKGFLIGPSFFLPLSSTRLRIGHRLPDRAGE